MTYQVLARKWRPKDFASLVGQEHVVRALTHALDGGRLHHAYLFTGTRGVGKTTLSRIFAKALNCETGVTSTPCGVCRACREIDEGRFVDYVEMDAASNRGVDEMAALLERAVYAPVDARFKVYMIDEVHMLTNHAFNAMLKTLEEPPSHVKFILATTDPQKIPVTVLSRCLQFNLKQMPAGHIVSHLEHILGEEHVPFDVQALRLLARAADGSMRDALSLTDQAIAYSANQVNEEAVRGMLGALDQSYLIRLLDALADGDGAAVLAVADEMALRSLSFSTALQDLASLLHRIAWAQFAPSSVLDEWPEAGDLRRFADALSAEHVQLFYQIATIGRSELGLAPDEYAGFTMTLLRMLAFEPAPKGGGAAGASGASRAAGQSGAGGVKRSGAVAAQGAAASARTGEVAAGVMPRAAQAPQSAARPVAAGADQSAAVAGTGAGEMNGRVARVADAVDSVAVAAVGPESTGYPANGVKLKRGELVAEAASVGDPVRDGEVSGDAGLPGDTPNLSAGVEAAASIAADAETVPASPAPQTGATDVIEDAGASVVDAASLATGVARDRETLTSGDAFGGDDASSATDVAAANAGGAVADENVGVGAGADTDPVADTAAIAASEPVADATDVAESVSISAPVVVSTESIASTVTIAATEPIAIPAATDTPPQSLTPPAAAAIARSEAVRSQPVPAVAAGVPPRRAGGASAALDVLRSAGLKVSSDRGRPGASAHTQSAAPVAPKPAAPRVVVPVPTPGAARRAPQQDGAAAARAQAASPSAQRNGQHGSQPDGQHGDTRSASSGAAYNDPSGNADSYGSSIPPWDDMPPDDGMPLSASDDGYFGPPDDGYMPVFDSGPDDVRVNAAPASPPPVVDKRPLPPAVPLDPLGFTGDWPALAVDLPLKGISYQLAFNSELMALDGGTLRLNVPVPQYAEASQVAKLKAALAERLGRQVDVLVEVGPARRTAAAHDAAVRAQRQQEAEREIGADPFVQSLIREFGASIVPGSIRPLVPAGSSGANHPDAGHNGAPSTH